MFIFEAESIQINKDITLKTTSGSQGLNIALRLLRHLGPFCEKASGEYDHDEEPDEETWPLQLIFKNDQVYINDKVVEINESNAEIDPGEMQSLISDAFSDMFQEEGVHSDAIEEEEPPFLTEEETAIFTKIFIKATEDSNLSILSEILHEAHPHIHSTAQKYESAGELDTDWPDESWLEGVLEASKSSYAHEKHIGCELYRKKIISVISKLVNRNCFGTILSEYEKLLAFGCFIQDTLDATGDDGYEEEFKGLTEESFENFYSVVCMERVGSGDSWGF